MNELEAILEELRLLRNEVESLKAVVEVERRRDKMFGEWASEKEISELTKLHRNTLNKLFRNAQITKTTLTGKKKNYYRLSDFRKMLDRNEKEN